MAKPTPRKKKNQIVVWIILGLLVVSLVGFGVQNVGQGGQQAVASVGDEEVTVDTYVRAMRNQLAALSQQFGQNITMEQARAFNLDQQVLASVLITAAYDGENRRLGLSVGDNRVRDELMATQAFQSLTGGFDETAYTVALAQAGISPAEYDRIVRESSSRAILQAAVTGGIATNETLALALLGFISEERDFRWAVISDTLLDSPVPDPSDAEINAQYSENAEAYTAPETRKITYAWIIPEMIYDSIEIDEAELRDLYEARTEIYNIPARRIVDRLVFSSTEEAQAALDQIIGGSKNFEDILADRGLTPADVDMGEVIPFDLSDPAAEAVFALNDTGIVGPVDSDLGPALFRVNAILQARNTPFEVARTELRRELVADRARRQLDADFNAIEDLLAGGASLEELAAETPLELARIDFAEGTESGIAAYQEFRDLAAVVTTEDFPEINTLPDGGLFTIRLDAIQPPTLQPLSEVREQVIADWRAAETRRRLLEVAATLETGLKNGQSFEDLGLEARDETGIRRGDFIEGAPVDLIIQVFAAKDQTVELVEGDVIALFQLTGINPLENPEGDDRILLETLSQQFTQQLAADIDAAFATALQEEAGISVNQSLLNAVNIQLGGGGGRNESVPHIDVVPH